MTIIEKDKKSIEEMNQIVSEKKGKRKPLLSVKNLKTYFYTEEGVVKAVDGVSFDIYEDEVLGLVGETGCGKSVTALSILRLVRAPGKIIDGKITFNDTNLLDISEEDMRSIRGKDITMIFQDPLNSLNPVISVGDQLAEVFSLHQKDKLRKTLDKRILVRKKNQEKIKQLKEELKDQDRLTAEDQARINSEINELKEKTKILPTLNNIIKEKSSDIIKEVGIADAMGILKRYPHELSGGMRQRVMVSMALSCNPHLLIADEPTTALDVTIQAQILDLMNHLKKKFNTSILMITHDLGIIADLCDRVAVMYSGNIVEYASVKDLFKNPRHPYTIGLISAIPSLETKDQKLLVIRGMVPNLIYPPSGCRFHPRCDHRMEICDKVKPRFLEISERYFIACHLFDPKYKDSPKYEWEKKEEKASYLV
ncbi:MAG: ABC transporter ATP-binding protein [Promethearchaeota archaeon]